MKVYLAWSSETSRRLAEAFQNWLPRVIQHITLFYSPSDVDKGTRWASVISNELETCNAGLLFITPDNINSNWIHFEAGALSKAVDNSRVTPVLFGIESSQVPFPLAQFQNSQFNKDDILKLLHDYNNLSEAKISTTVLNDSFDAFWFKLEGEVNAILSEKSPKQEVISNSEETLGEILDIVRYTAKQVQNLTYRQDAESHDLEDTVDSRYVPGLKVRHRIFGIGVVLSKRKTLDDTQLDVAFPKVGIKKLLLSFAHLDIIDDLDASIDKSTSVARDDHPHGLD